MKSPLLKSAKSGSSLAGCLLWMLGLVVALPALVGGIIERQSSLIGSGIALIVIFGLIWRVAANAAKRIDNDVATKNILSAPGEVVWRKDSYVPITNGRRLKIATKNYGAPIPGPHEMFFLGRTGYLLATAPLLAAPPAARATTVASDPHAVIRNNEPARLALLDAVTKANGFRPSALVQNRVGTMTAGQRWRLFRSFQGTGIAFLVQMVIALALIGSPLIGGANYANLSTLARIALVAGGVALLAYTLIWTLRSLYQHMGDIMTGHLASKETKVSLDQRYSESERDSTTYYYIADDLRFRVSNNAYNALIPSIRYRLYYTPKSKILMNIEPLELPTT